MKEIDEIIERELNKQKEKFEADINILKSQLQVLQKSKNKFTIICNSCGGINIFFRWDIGDNIVYLECKDCGSLIIAE